LLTKPIIAVGFNKNGEADFAVDSAVYDLAPDRLNELAAMCFAAFHAAYGMRNRGDMRDDDEEAEAQAARAARAGRTGQAPA
jgi:hypothetical protein